MANGVRLNTFFLWSLFRWRGCSSVIIKWINSMGTEKGREDANRLRIEFHFA